MIYRLVTANTIDQKIVERAAAKRKLEKMVIHKSKFKAGAENVKSSLKSISAQELLTLLDSKDYVGSVVAKEKYNVQVAQISASIFHSMCESFSSFTLADECIKVEDVIYSAESSDGARQPEYHQFSTVRRVFLTWCRNTQP